MFYLGACSWFVGQLKCGGNDPCCFFPSFSLFQSVFLQYVVAMGMSEESPFLKSALTQPWRLSTSQTPYQQTDVWDLFPPELAHHACSGGGFGPVADDGYGCSYLVAGEDRFYFHISSKRSSPMSSSSRFAQHLKIALADMRSLLH